MRTEAVREREREERERERARVSLHFSRIRKQRRTFMNGRQLGSDRQSR